MKGSEVSRLERYLRFHLEEIVEELGSDQKESDTDSRLRAKWGWSAYLLKKCLLKSREEIVSALVRIREGTYGNCINCGNEIDPRQLDAVPWSKYCIACQEESKQKSIERIGSSAVRWSS